MAKKTDTARPRARNDAYVMMLFVTFLAIVGGCVLMYLDNEEYGGKPPPTAPKIGEIDTKTAGPADAGAPKVEAPKVEAPKVDGKMP